jgi:hypothetical protein
MGIDREMREYWINVNYSHVTKATWLGASHDAEWKAKVVATKYTIYRIHVRLK